MDKAGDLGEAQAWGLEREKTMKAEEKEKLAQGLERLEREKTMEAEEEEEEELRIFSEEPLHIKQLQLEMLLEIWKRDPLKRRQEVEKALRLINGPTPPPNAPSPHPAIWRLVHGMAVIYLIALTLLLFQKRGDARQFMRFLHPDLGVELPERSYGDDCRIYMPENPTRRFKNVYDTF